MATDLAALRDRAPPLVRENLHTVSPGLWVLAWRRLKSDRVGMVSLVIVAAFIIMMILSATGLIASDWNREVGIKSQLYNFVHLVRFEHGRIEFRPNEHAPRDLAARTMKLLEQWTGTRWVVTISQERGDPTFAEQDAAAQQRLLDAAEQLPVVQAVKEAFPGAVVRKVTPRKPFAEAEDETPFLEAPEDPDEDDDDERMF